MDWWNEMTGLQLAFAYIALPATIIMGLHFIMSLCGFNGEGDAEGIDGADDFVDGDVDMDFDDGVPLIYRMGNHRMFMKIILLNPVMKMRIMPDKAQIP